MKSSQILIGLSFLALHCALPHCAPAQTPPSVRPLAAETWTGTDALGRSLPTAGEVRPPQTGKQVGIFYFLWHSRDDIPFDNTKAIAANPKNPPYGPVTAFHWWGEPAVGYFRADDPWVARKNIQMLGDAGVDVLFLDVTNAATYPKDVETLFDMAETMRGEGFPVPKIGFLAHSSTPQVVTGLYQTYYAPGKYKDLWFLWDGKPLMLGDKTAKNDGRPIDPNIVDFFTWRDSWAWDPGQDKWQWIDKYPQRAGWHTDPNTPEEVPVSVAGHPTDNLGRSYHSDKTWGSGTEPPVDAQFRTPKSIQGSQFAQQWEQALKIDPQFLFITGWNEWIAQRFLSGAGGGPNFLGSLLKTGETFFVDNYNEEFSRDAMPMKGGYGDSYYLQMVAGIRRFKGAAPLPVSQGFRSISVSGPFSQWNSVEPRYLDALGDTMHRDHDGWKGRHYTDTSGRNDITSARVACDADNIYFYAHTQDALTPSTGRNWMQLLIDADLDPKTGWNGYDFVVSKGRLKRFRDGKTWPVSVRAAGNQMTVAVPRTLLGLNNLQKTTFDFHWIDNVPVGEGDIASWWYVGDSAPDGRFNYRYINQN